MMHKRKSSVLAVAVLALFAFTAGVTGTAAAKNFKIKNLKFSGTSMSTSFLFPATNSGRTTSTTVTGEGRRLGDFTAHTISQFFFATNFTTFGATEIKGVISAEKGQLYLDLPAPTAVDAGEFSLVDGTFSLTVTYDIVGGSGKFAGATGSLTSTSTGKLLTDPFEGEHQFGGVKGTLKGYFSTPH